MKAQQNKVRIKIIAALKKRSTTCLHAQTYTQYMYFRFVKPQGMGKSCIIYHTMLFMRVETS
ncbi:CLUMA_CG012748, isoform A [Clunio marinus]|uniref:CLUMA_CG012748, isoform A n=1 Tax=Clunio marinus TaxID=568069 RepID=A0A1J1IGA8_9DIPT|nr:CLUMA_CG012748, isoform A [Clunio marinus]